MSDTELRKAAEEYAESLAQSQVQFGSIKNGYIAGYRSRDAIITEMREALEFYANADQRFWELSAKTSGDPSFKSGGVARTVLSKLKGRSG